MPTPFGIWADAQFLGANRNEFYDIAQHFGSAHLIDDYPKYESTRELRSRNASMRLLTRRTFDDYEGKWHLCPHGDDKHLMRPAEMAEVLMDSYPFGTGALVNFWNEPSLFNDDLRQAVAFTIETLKILVAHKVPCVVWNAWSSTWQDKNGVNQLPILRPLFEFIFAHKDLLSLGLHEYMGVILDAGVGGVDQHNLLKFGSLPESSWASTDTIHANSANGLIGGYYHWIDYLKSINCYPLPIDITEGGWDDTAAPDVLEALHALNGGKPLSGVKNTEKVLEKHFPVSATVAGYGYEYILYRQLAWLMSNLTDLASYNFFAWTIQDEWKSYSIDGYKTLLKSLVDFNAGLKAVALPVPPPPIVVVPPPPPIVVTPPVIVPSPVPTTTLRSAFKTGEQAVIDAAVKADPDGWIARLAKAANWALPTA